MMVKKKSAKTNQVLKRNGSMNAANFLGGKGNIEQAEVKTPDEVKQLINKSEKIEA